jgi:hypothetical protein
MKMRKHKAAMRFRIEAVLPELIGSEGPFKKNLLCKCYHYFLMTNGVAVYDIFVVRPLTIRPVEKSCSCDADQYPARFPRYLIPPVCAAILNSRFPIDQKKTEPAP